MKRILFLVFIILITSCSVKTLRAPVTKDPASIRTTVSGLQSHTIYPNDMVWLNIYDGRGQNDDRLISRERLTIDSPLQNYQLDANQPYTFFFSSVQPVFGGYKYCNVQKIIEPRKNEKLQLDYKLIKGRCKIETRKR